MIGARSGVQVREGRVDLRRSNRQVPALVLGLVMLPVVAAAHLLLFLVLVPVIVLLVGR